MSLNPLQPLVHAGQAIYKRASAEFPIEVLLSWPTPNYVNPVRRDATVLYAVNGAVFFITLSCFILRLYARIRIRKWFGADDVFLSFAIVGAVGVSACVMLGTHRYEWERHIYDLYPTLIAPSGKLLYVAKILWAWTSTNVRLAVMSFYYRLLNHIGLNKYRWVLHVNTALIVAIFLVQEFTSIFTCLPIKAMWTWPPIMTAKCIDNGKAMIAGAALNTVSEFIVACLPLPVIAQLNLSRRQRTEVTALLCGGFLVVICGCVRTYYIGLTATTYDMSWWAMPHWITSEVEIDIAIMCACAPVLRPMVGRALSGGLSAALFPRRKETRPSKGYFGGRLHKTFFSKSGSGTGYSTNTTRSLSNRDSHKDIDLEGIGNDGFGYCVTISTAHGTRVKKRWDIRNKVWHYYPEVKEEEDESIAPKSQRGSELKPKFDIEGTFNDAIKPLEIQTERTVELRESFHEDRLGRGWDVRNPYGKEHHPFKYEEDIEVAMQVPEAPLSDWSILDGDSSEILQPSPIPIPPLTHDPQHSRRTSSQVVPADALQPKRPETAYVVHEPKLITSVDQIRSGIAGNKTALIHKVRRSQDNIRAGILPSPTTIASNHGRKRSPSPPPRGTKSTPTPPPPPALPPAGRFPRTASPVVQPLNSSQDWATSPHVAGLQRTASQQKNFKQGNMSSPDKQLMSHEDEVPMARGLQRRPSQQERQWPLQTRALLADSTDTNKNNDYRPARERSTSANQRRGLTQQRTTMPATAMQDNVAVRETRRKPSVAEASGRETQTQRGRQAVLHNVALASDAVGRRQQIGSQYHDESSDDEFDLPLQIPSPRNLAQGVAQQGTFTVPPAPRLRVGDYG